MSVDPKVKITDHAIITALNTPGGAVYEWRDNVGRRILDICELSSPVNDVLNAMHRNGVVGTYKFGWRGDRRGSRGHRMVARIYNEAGHAWYVEYGRTASTKVQTFSWTKWHGQTRTIGGETEHGLTGTGPRRGRHILRDTVNEVLSEECGGSYLPLTH